MAVLARIRRGQDREPRPRTALPFSQVAINERTNTIYVVNTHADSVSVIDGARHAVVATVPTGRGPWALAVDPVTNMVYVANRLSDTVTVIDGRTNAATQR